MTPLIPKPRTKAPLRYLGAKQRLAPHIVSLFPPHDTYVEVCLGAGSVLFTKPPSRLEVANDIDSAVTNFFTVLRNHYPTFRATLDKTPYSHAEYDYCRLNWHKQTDPIERARQWFVAASCAFGGHMGRTGWARSLSSQAHEPNKFRNNIERLEWFTHRLARVQIDNLDFQDCIEMYDGPNVLFYLDPPYLAETRKDGEYACEMTTHDHATLLTLITRCTGMVILSGYDNPLYAEALAGWPCERIPVVASSIAKTRTSGFKGAGSLLERGQREECLWRKPNTVKPIPCPQPTLFEVAP